MQHLLFLIHCLVAGLLLVQSLLIGARFGKNLNEALVWYRRFLVLQSLVLLGPAFQEYFFLNILPLDFTNLQLNGLAYLQSVLRGRPDAWLPFIASVTLIAVCNIALLPAIIALLVVAILRSEGFPITRWQHRALHATVATSISLVVVGLGNWAIFVVNMLWLSGSTRNLEMISAVFSLVATSLTIGLIGLWCVLAIRARLFADLPDVLRAGRAATVLSAVLLVIYGLEYLDQNGALKLPFFTILVANTRATGLQTHWLVGATWGIAGLWVLRRAPVASTGTAAPGDQAPSSAPDPSRIFSEHGLSEREQQIAELIVQGQGNKEIAASLDISYHTVKNHVANIFQKLRVTSRFELIRFLRQV